MVTWKEELQSLGLDQMPERWLRVDDLDMYLTSLKLAGEQVVKDKPTSSDKVSSNKESCVSNSSEDHLCALDIKHVVKEELQSLGLDQMPERQLRVGDLDMNLTSLNLTGEVTDKPTNCSMVSSNKESCVGDSNENRLCALDIKHGSKKLHPSILKQMLEREWEEDHRYQNLLEPLPTWEQKVVEVLHVIRCRELNEPRHMNYLCNPTRFCHFNMAFFNLDEESKIKHGPLLSEIPPDKYLCLDASVNVISIQIAESDVPDPIHIYGTVLARDQNDYKCVYLFKRGRDEPQLITRQNCTLALTGPYRALGGRCFMYFEFHLKIKGKGGVDQDFSKGLLVRNVCGDTPHRPSTLSLKSSLSTVDLVYVHIPFASAASIGVNVLNGKTNFTGKISAWTSGNGENKIVLYDSEVAGTETNLGSGGSVFLSRSIISVPLDEDLVLGFSDCEENCNPKCNELVLGHNDQGQTCYIGPYQVDVKIIWRGVTRPYRPGMWKYIGDSLVLW